MNRISFVFMMMAMVLTSSSIIAQPGPGGQSFVSYTSTPECEGSKNGRIRINISDNIPQGWSFPFTYRYENLDNGDVGDGVCTSNMTIIPNLTTGNYKVFVDLDVSCMVVGTISVAETPNTLDLIIESDLNNACTIGKLIANVSGGNPGYNFQWSNGSTQQSAQNLAEGQHCVTITDQLGCVIEDCEIINDNSFTIEVLKLKNVTTCHGQDANSEDGLIIVDVDERPNLTYQYNWKGPQGINLSGPEIQELYPGDYDLTVTNSAGCKATLNLKLCCCQISKKSSQYDPNIDCFGGSTDKTFSVNLDGEIEHPTFYNSDGEIKLKILGNGTGKLTYEWSGPNGFTSYQKNISNLSVGEYCVTVTDGCKSQKRCYELYYCKIKYELINACTNYSDGKIIIKINNPNLYQYIVKNNGVTLQSTPPVKYYEYIINNLMKDSHNNIEVIVGEHVESRYFNIASQKIAYKLTSVQGENTCNYDAYCNDNLIQEDALIRDLNPDYNEAVGNGGSCEINFYCDKVRMKTKSYDKSWTSVGQYRAMIYVAMNSGTLPAYWLDQCLADVADEDDCARIRYCEANFDRRTVIGAKWKNCGGAQQQSNLNCWKMDCCWVDGGNWEFCACDEIPDYLKEVCETGINPTTGENYKDCNPKQFRIYELIQNLTWLNQQNGFIDSDLYRLLEKVMADEELLKKSICGFVTYCSSDFSNVKDNLDLVFCDDIYGYFCTTLPTGEIIYEDYYSESCIIEIDPETGEQYAICNNHGIKTYTKIRNLSQNFASPIESNVTTNFINDELNYSEFIALSNTFTNEYIEPKGIVRSEFDKSYLIENGIHNQITEITGISNAILYHDDWDKDYQVFVNEITKNTDYQLYFEINSNENTRSLSNTYINVEAIYNHGDKIYLTGSTQGPLTYDNQIVSQFDTLEYFIAQFDTLGTFMTIDKIQFKGKLESSFTKNGIKLSGLLKPNVGNFQINNSPFVSNNKMITITQNQLGTSMSVGQGISITGNVSVLKSIFSENDSTQVILLKGIGQIETLASELIQIQENEVVGLILDINQQLLGKVKMIAPGLNAKFITTTTNKQQEIFVSVSFDSSLQIENLQPFVSNGKKDIPLMKLNRNGSISGLLQYGSTENEEVIELKADDQRVFLGGNLTGPINDRIIGDYRFKSNSCIMQSGFISSVAISQFNPQGVGAQKKLEKKIDPEKSISIYPNPTSGIVTIKTNQEVSIGSIEVYNSLGTLLLLEEPNERQEEEFYNLNLSKFSSGYYIVVVRDKAGIELLKNSIFKL